MSIYHFLLMSTKEKKKGRQGIRYPIWVRFDPFISRIGIQRLFDIGLEAVKLSRHCPLALTCIYVHKTGKRFSRCDLPCESPAHHAAQDQRPLGWLLCPIRAAVCGQKENVPAGTVAVASDIPGPGGARALLYLDRIE